MIRLSWPPRALHPNSRTDRRAATPQRAKARMDGLILARQHMQSGGIATDHMILTFCPPDLIRRDIDGAFSALKSTLDGIAQGVKRDDRHWTFTLKWGPVDRLGGHVDLVFAVDIGALPLAGWIS